MESSPCTSASGYAQEPHRVRERIAAGELVVVTTEAARRRRMLRSLHELAATTHALKRNE